MYSRDSFDVLNFVSKHFRVSVIFGLIALLIIGGVVGCANRNTLLPPQYGHAFTRQPQHLHTPNLSFSVPQPQTDYPVEQTLQNSQPFSPIRQVSGSFADSPITLAVGESPAPENVRLLDGLSDWKMPQSVQNQFVDPSPQYGYDAAGYDDSGYDNSEMMGQIYYDMNGLSEIENNTGTGNRSLASLFSNTFDPKKFPLGRNANTTRQQLVPETIQRFGNAIANEYKPLINRKWDPNHAVQATAQINGDTVMIHNIRSTKYNNSQEFTVSHYDDSFSLSTLQTLDLIEIPFRGNTSLAHVEVSFGFSDGRYLVFSAEARYENGESYDPVGGMCNQFEMIYTIADERDAIELCTEVIKNDVFLYRLDLTTEEVQTIFVDMLNRANKLSTTPEFYHTVRNNCTSNVIMHINRARPGAIPREYRAFFPGYLDHLLYDLKMFKTDAETYKAAKDRAYINNLSNQYRGTDFFSEGIRQNLF